MLQRLVLELHLDLDRNQSAADLSNELVKVYPDDGPLLYLRGIALRRLGQKDKAHEAFSRATFLAPLEPRAWGAVAAGWIERNELDKSASIYRIALFLDDASQNYWGDLGQVEVGRGQYASAHHALSKAIENGGHTFTNYFTRGICSQILGDDLDSVRDWARALGAEPER